MAKPRTCLNCGKDIGHRGTRAKTCDATCRKALERKTQAAADIAAVVAEAPPSAHLGDAASIAKREVEAQVRDIVKPVVREALTEDVLGALQDLIRLTPAAVATLADHMDGDDPVLAQKAATTTLRYTVGHQALVTPQAATAPQLVVNFDLPRPAPGSSPDDPDDEDSFETFECDVCHTVHLIAERVAGANRCVECHEKRKAAVLEQYGLLDSNHD
jgi:hypothetical protein